MPPHGGGADVKVSKVHEGTSAKRIMIVRVQKVVHKNLLIGATSRLRHMTGEFEERICLLWAGRDRVVRKWTRKTVMIAMATSVVEICFAFAKLVCMC